MDLFESYFGLRVLYRVILFILFYKRVSSWDKTQCDVRCMEKYVTLNVPDSLYVDYVVSDVWNSSYVNMSICDIIYGGTHKFV